MKITKVGHCCMIIEDAGLRIMTDPGNYTTTEQEVVKNIDYIIISHEHSDHLHVESLKTILANNPNAKVITNQGVGEILSAENIPYEILGAGQSKQIGEFLIEGFGTKHAPIYPGLKEVENTSYFFNNRFFYPGDAFYNPNKPVEILALPVVAPWLKISEPIDYAKTIKPQICFPIHDWNVKRVGSCHIMPQQFLTEAGIDFRILEIGKEYEF